MSVGWGEKTEIRRAQKYSKHTTLLLGREKMLINI